MSKINNEGLTLAEWLAAANLGGAKVDMRTYFARLAWQAGEDPTEYAAQPAQAPTCAMHARRNPNKEPFPRTVDTQALSGLEQWAQDLRTSSLQLAEGEIRSRLGQGGSTHLMPLTELLEVLAARFATDLVNEAIMNGLLRGWLGTSQARAGDKPRETVVYLVKSAL